MPGYHNPSNIDYRELARQAGLSSGGIKMRVKLYRHHNNWGKRRKNQGMALPSTSTGVPMGQRGNGICYFCVKKARAHKG